MFCFLLILWKQNKNERYGKALEVVFLKKIFVDYFVVFYFNLLQVSLL